MGPDAPAPAQDGPAAGAGGAGADQRHGSHATPAGQGLSWVLTWTILGTLVPGSGLFAAGLTRAGGLVMLLLVLAGIAAAGFAVLGHPVQYVVGLAVDPQRLLLLAVLTGVLALGWVLVILLTDVSLRRRVELGAGQRAFSGIVVLALAVGVLLPAYEVGRYALIQRDLVSSVFSAPARAGHGAGPVAAAADPWAGVPRENVLLIGSDAGADRTGIRPDTMILASIDTRTGDTVLFSLPRSLQHAPFPAGTGGHQAWPQGFYCPQIPPGNTCLLNAVWTWASGDGRRYYAGSPDPGLQATEDAVQGVTGLHVDTYAMLNLAGFQAFVNAIGGVTVNVNEPEPLPIGGDSEHKVATGGYIMPGRHQHLDGYHALWFARSRWSTDDYDRMQRQRCVIGAVVGETNPLTVFKAFPAIAKAAKNNVSTGIPQEDLTAWLTLAQRIQKGTVKSLPFTDKVINTVQPDFAEIHRLVRAAIRPAKKPTPAGTPTSTPTRTPKPDAGKAQDVAAVC